MNHIPENGADTLDQTSVHLRRAVDGDQASLEEAIRRLTPALVALANLRLRSVPAGVIEATDLVQEIWLGTLPNLGNLIPKDGKITKALLAYMGTAMRRKTQRILERQLRQPRAAVAEPERGDPFADLAHQTRGVISHVLADEGASLVHEALDALSETDREVVLLRGIEQCSVAEVALIVAQSEDVVKQRYRRALARLRKELPGSVFDGID